MALGPIKTHYCIKGCGWHREYRTDDRWCRQILDHPIYGPTANAAIVVRDIVNHNCNEHKAAMERAEKRRNVER